MYEDYVWTSVLCSINLIWRTSERRRLRRIKRNPSKRRELNCDFVLNWLCACWCITVEENYSKDCVELKILFYFSCNLLETRNHRRLKQDLFGCFVCFCWCIVNVCSNLFYVHLRCVCLILLHLRWLSIAIIVTVCRMSCIMDGILLHYVLHAEQLP